MNVLRDFFLQNLGLKVISLLLAFILWLTFAVPEPIQRTLSLPVEFVNMPPQLEISADYDKEVEVVIRSERSITSFNERQLAVVLDLRNATAGTERIPLTEENIRNKPSGVEILSLTPPRILLQLENTLRRLVKVTPALVGSPAEGFEVVSTQADPREVMISGPESRVSDVSTAETAPIEVEGLSSTFMTMAYLDLEDPRLRIENRTSVNVVVNIEEKRREIRIRSVPIRVLPEGAQVRLSRRRVDVVGTVPISFEGELTAGDLEVSVNVEPIEPRPQPHELVPQVAVPGEYSHVFRVTSTVPEQVNVWKIR